ncbi:MAG: hypothetical protein GXP49_16255 [Deltaproteobacteria bacterium]|nr:hypothetical protein [Deltaproteobacteria bacterium]
MEGFYRFLARPAMESLARLGSCFHKELRVAMQARRNSPARFSALNFPDSDSSRLWVHAPSLGELYLMEQVLIELEKAAGRPFSLLVTVTSPSAIDAARNLATGTGMADFLPPDSKKNMELIFSMFLPDIVLISQYDLWPGMIFEAARRSVPMALIGAVVRRSTMKRRFPARMLYSRLYALLSLATATSERSASNLVHLGIRKDAVEATGDPRVDRAARLAGEPGADRASNLSKLDEGMKWIVAGSTYPKDEQMLFKAFTQAKLGSLGFGLVVAPHDLNDSRLEEIEESAKRSGLKSGRMSSPIIGDDTRVVLLDEFGLLAHAYGKGVMAYLGGGFNKGVHNVLEAAAHGVAIVFGPKHEGAEEAVELLSIGGAVCVSGTKDLSQVLSKAAHRPDWIEAIGLKAREYIDMNKGASKRTALELVKRFPQVFLSKAGDHGVT